MNLDQPITLRMLLDFIEIWGFSVGIVAGLLWICVRIWGKR